MKVLVTGASGNVGSYAVKELLKMGEKVVVAGTDATKLNDMFGDKVDVVEFDFTKAQTYKDALNGVDRIFKSWYSICSYKTRLFYAKCVGYSFRRN